MPSKTILIIDDEADNVAFVSAVLKREGFSVIAAQDGVEGVNKAVVETPDLIVLDIQMPRLNGFEVFTRLQETEATREIPVVMLTGIREKIGRGYSDRDVKTLLGTSPAGYLEKPVVPEELIALVKAHA